MNDASLIDRLRLEVAYWQDRWAEREHSTKPLNLIDDGVHFYLVPRDQFYLRGGDVIERRGLRFRVDRIETVQDGPDAGRRDVLTVTALPPAA